MIPLLLSKSIWSSKTDNGASERRISRFNELEKIIWALMTSEGRSEARLWLCNAVSSISSITPHEQCDLFMNLLRSKPVKRDLATQVLQMIFEKRPHKAGLILAKKCRMLEKFFAGHPRRILQWFSTFSLGGDSEHGKGAKALSQFAFVNRDICWEELEWKGKHGQSPAVVATKPHYFLDLDVLQTIENFIENVPEFWSSDEFSESLKDGEILFTDKAFFLDFFVDLMYKENLKLVWEIVSDFLMEESFSYLCHHLLIVLNERDLFLVLETLHDFLTRRKEIVDFSSHSYWIEILISKCANHESIDRLLLLNALVNKGRQLLRLVHREDADEDDKEKIQDLTLQICKTTNDAQSLVPVSRECLEVKTLEVMKFLGLLSWSLLYRLSEECRTPECWELLFLSNEIGFRKSDKYGLVHQNRTSDDSGSDFDYKNKKRRKTRRKRKRNLDCGQLYDDEWLELDDYGDRMSLQSTAGSWLLSTDGYSTSWSSTDLPECVAKYCLSKWMKQIFDPSKNAA